MQRTPAMRALVPALLVAMATLAGCDKTEAPQQQTASLPQS